MSLRDPAVNDPTGTPTKVAKLKEPISVECIIGRTVNRPATG